MVIHSSQNFTNEFFTHTSTTNHQAQYQTTRCSTNWNAVTRNILALRRDGVTPTTATQQQKSSLRNYETNILASVASRASFQNDRSRAPSIVVIVFK